MINNRYKFLTRDEEYDVTNLVRDAFLAAKNGDEVSVLIDALLTTDEKIKLGRRIQVGLALMSGVTGSEIMEELHVGRNTITLVSKHLAKYSKGFEMVLLRRKKVNSDYKKNAYKKMGSSLQVFKKKEFSGYTRKKVER